MSRGQELEPTSYKQVIDLRHVPKRVKHPAPLLIFFSIRERSYGKDIMRHVEQSLCTSVLCLICIVYVHLAILMDIRYVHGLHLDYDLYEN